MIATSGPSVSDSRRPEPEAALEARHGGARLAEAQVDGPGQVGSGPHGGARLVGIGGREHGDPGLRAHDRIVLEGEVRRAVVAVVQSAADADDADGQAVQPRARCG